MSIHRAGRKVRALTLILAASPLATPAARAQGGGQAIALDEISVTSEGNGAAGSTPVSVSRGGAGGTPAGPSVSAPTPLDRPVGEVVTSVGREGVIDNRAATTVADILRNSPGVTVRQGNGPRDVVVSIRGNNARATGVSRNFVVLEDGFPVTQADGSSRFDLVDPRAYSRIDVFRGPQSPFFGNFATGGALNFVTRRGSEINGVEYGVDAGSFGYLNNYATFGGVSGPFEYSLFTSDTRGNGILSHNAFDTQTINFLGTYAPTPDDRFTLKIINNEVSTDLPGRGSLNQFRLNPFQRGCASALTAAPGCVTYTLRLNGGNGATVPVTADEGAFFRGDLFQRFHVAGGENELGAGPGQPGRQAPAVETGTAGAWGGITGGTAGFTAIGADIRSSKAGAAKQHATARARYLVFIKSPWFL